MSVLLGAGPCLKGIRRHPTSPLSRGSRAAGECPRLADLPSPAG